MHARQTWDAEEIRFDYHLVDLKRRREDGIIEADARRFDVVAPDAE